VSRPRKPTPRYLLHKQSGRGRAVWTDSAGNYCDKLLPGAYGSAKSKAAFTRLLMEHEAAPHNGSRKKSDLVIIEVLKVYLEYAKRHYRRPDGSPTSELREHKLTMRTLRELYGEQPAAEFGPLKLKAARQHWVASGLSRSECNRRTNIARRIFKWAVAEELVDSEVLMGLNAVAGLQKGRTPARETEPIQPVADAVVDATLPHLNRYVAGLIEFQRLTGCRPGEACRVRRSDIDTGGAIWLYKPREHKTAHRGKSRVIACGPRAQHLLRQFFTVEVADYLFSPRRAVAELHAERSKGRKTPLFRSHVERNSAKRVRNPKKSPADRYTPESYSHAIARACDRAFPPPGKLAQRKNETHNEWWNERLTAVQREEVKEWRKAHRWQPNQLRHTFATRVRKQHGLEAAQVMLGHARADVTQVYAERNEAVAAGIAAKIG
jgi:integrase